MSNRGENPEHISTILERVLRDLTARGVTGESMRKRAEGNRL